MHQIDEPQADALLELAAYRFTVANREARIAELEAELAAAPQAAHTKGVFVDAGALQMVLNALERDALEGKQVRAEMRLALMKSVAATHPTQQGLTDLRWQIVHDHVSGEYIAGRACFVVQIPPLPGANIMRGSVAEHFTKAVDALAAQAKQGG